MTKPRLEYEGNCSAFLKIYRKSVYKLIWKQFHIYIIASYIFHAVFTYYLDENQQQWLEKIRTKLAVDKLNLIVITVLGIFMSKMVDRFWTTYQLIRYPDHLALHITTAVSGYSRLQRTLRSTITRYVLASYILTLNKISRSVDKRFPNLQAIESAGVLTKQEVKSLESYKHRMTEFREPLDWAAKLICRGYNDNLVGRGGVDRLLSGLAAHCDNMSRLLAHHNVGAPPHYATVVDIIVWLYNILAFVDQVISSNKGNWLEFTLHPWPAALIFMCYHSVAKVGKTMNNPFRLRYDDLELNRMIDDRIETVIVSFRNMLAERRDCDRDHWYEQSLFDERQRTFEPPAGDTRSAEEEIDNIYEDIDLNYNGLATQAFVESDNDERIVQSVPETSQVEVHACETELPPNPAPEMSLQSIESEPCPQQTLLQNIKNGQMVLKTLDEMQRQLEEANKKQKISKKNECNSMLQTVTLQPLLQQHQLTCLEQDPKSMLYGSLKLNNCDQPIEVQIIKIIDATNVQKMQIQCSVKPKLNSECKITIEDSSESESQQQETLAVTTKSKLFKRATKQSIKTVKDNQESTDDGLESGPDDDAEAAESEDQSLFNAKKCMRCKKFLLSDDKIIKLEKQNPGASQDGFFQKIQCKCFTWL